MADLYEAAQQGNLKEVTRFVSQGGRDINWALPTVRSRCIWSVLVASACVRVFVSAEFDLFA